MPGGSQCRRVPSLDPSVPEGTVNRYPGGAGAAPKHAEINWGCELETLFGAKEALTADTDASMFPEKVSPESYEL